ncbi:zinc finger BED domain-containing protein 4 isoform X1 [Spodoptera litura]|uniref:Zinc finger BED domain-containing protein 4 isoform X1 n=1 Tax=Spodoptera litura TaxID=69820 RepID=A0A9J7E785_SPOLT|nr:zinc finger BED domain-containing protein 4 isoform X1 [Spodoptera litura]
MSLVNISNPLWNYYVKLPYVRVANCKLCKCDYSYKTSITNLKAHLRMKHKTEYNSYLAEVEKRKRRLTLKMYRGEEDDDEEDDEEQLIELPTGDNKTCRISLIEIKREDDLDNHSPEPCIEASTSEQQAELANPTPRIKYVFTNVLDQKQKLINGKLLKMILKTYQPLSIVEDHDFVEFVEALNGEYKIPSRLVIAEKVIPALYDKCLNNQKILMHEAESVCLTSELWTSTSNDTFMCISGHYINKDFQFKSIVLKCWHLSSTYSSIDLATIFRFTCLDWGIFDKINMCVTDNNRDVMEAVTSLGWDHCSCIAQKLNNILQNFTNIYETTLKKFNTIAYRYQLCNKDEKALGSSQMRVSDNEVPLEFLKSMPTMWNSIYLMIERFINLKNEIKEIDKNIITDLPDITDDEWTSLNQLYLMLKPFYEAITELISEKYIYASKGIAIINGLKDVMKELEKKPRYHNFLENILKPFSTKLYEDFSSKEYEAKLAICTILDPRYKTEMFIDEVVVDTVETAKSNLVVAVQQMIKNECQNETNSDPGDQSTMEDDDADGEINLWRRRSLSIRNRKKCSDFNQLVLAQQEVSTYLQGELAESSCDPCDWWQTNQLKYPHLAKIFKMKCNIVANSVPSELIFTKNGVALRDRRARLPLEETEQFVVLNANLSETDYEDFVPRIQGKLFNGRNSTDPSMITS